MSQLKGGLNGSRKNHRLIRTYTTSKPSSTLTSTPTSSTPQEGGTPVPSSTPSLAAPSSTPTLAAPSSTPPSTPVPSSTASQNTLSSTPSSRPTSSSTPSSIPTSTPSSTPSSSTPVASEQQGSTLGSTQIDGRLCIGIRGKELNPSGKCSSFIYASFFERADPSGDKWATLSEDTKLFYWEEFQKKCHWDVEVHGLVKDTWEAKAKERYRQYIYNMRSAKRNQKPPHIEEEVWTAWNAIWSSDDFKNKSEQNKKNRRRGAVDGPALPTHNGGSASHQQIAIDFEEHLGHPPSCYDVFMYTHTKDHDGKSFTNDRVKQVHDYVVSRRADLELIGEEVDDTELFYRAVGGHDRKRRIYGLGSYGKSILIKNASQTCTEADKNSDRNNLETKLQKLEEVIEQQRIDLNDMRNTVNNMRGTIDE